MLQKVCHYYLCVFFILLWLSDFVWLQLLDIPYRQPCLQYVPAQWPCFCPSERYSRSQNLKQKAEPAVWTASDLFLQRFTKRVINTDKSSSKRSEREAIPPCLNYSDTRHEENSVVCVCVCVHAYRRVHVSSRSEGEEDSAKCKATQSVYSQLCLLWAGLTTHPAGTFEDEGCRFIKVHSELLKH